MNDSREQLHTLVDQLPEIALDHAKVALAYCKNPEKQRVAIETAKRRVRDNSERHLREHIESTGQGLISGIGSGSGHTFLDGCHHSSMLTFVDGKEATFHIYVFRGHMFEIIETLEISDDGQHLIRRERIKGADGVEQVITAQLPTTGMR